MMPHNKIKVIKLLPFILLTFLNAQSCKSPTAPEALQPGRRDYTWIVDTLNIPYTVLESIWGSSPNDVWAVGPAGDKDKTIYHFDGTKWNNDGISRPLAPRCVFGFAQNNVWFGSYGNTIWHYDGNTIAKFQDYTVPDYSLAGIENIWGDSPTNIYAVGYADSNNIFRGLIQHFDGNQWNILYLSPLNYVWQNYVQIYRNNYMSDHNYYLLSFFGSNNDSAAIYQYDGNSKLKKLYSDWNTRTGIELLNNEVYFILENRVCTWQNNNFNTFFTISGSSALYGFAGRSKEDIILEMSDGIAHYNGSDIKYLYHFNNPRISIEGEPVIFDKEVFILAYDYQNNLNLVFRGKLN